MANINKPPVNTPISGKSGFATDEQVMFQQQLFLLLEALSELAVSTATEIPAAPGVYDQNHTQQIVDTVNQILVDLNNVITSIRSSLDA